jgi:hypothetical protein
MSKVAVKERVVVEESTGVLGGLRFTPQNLDFSRSGGTPKPVRKALVLQGPRQEVAKALKSGQKLVNQQVDAANSQIDGVKSTVTNVSSVGKFEVQLDAKIESLR